MIEQTNQTISFLLLLVFFSFVGVAIIGIRLLFLRRQRRKIQKKNAEGISEELRKILREEEN